MWENDLRPILIERYSGSPGNYAVRQVRQHFLKTSTNAYYLYSDSAFSDNVGDTGCTLSLFQAILCSAYKIQLALQLSLLPRTASQSERKSGFRFMLNMFF